MRRTSRFFSSARSLAWLLGCLPLWGCSGDSRPPEEPSQPAFAGQSLSVVVVDDAPLAKVVEQLSQEWSARTGAKVTVTQANSDELIPSGMETAAAPLGDVLLYPAFMLGGLAEQNMLAEFPKAALADPSYNAREVFPVLRDRAAVWEGKTMAIPFGSALAVFAYRPDLFEKHGKTPPKTWEEYQDLATFFQAQATADSGSADGLETGTLEPLAPGEAGHLFLARAAGYALNPEFFFTLFDEETMEPRITSPPFRRAMDELVAAAQLRAKNAAPLTGEQALDQLLQGRAAMAIVWTLPRAAASSAKAASANGKDLLPVEFAPLPAGSTVYTMTGAPGGMRRNQIPVLPGWGRLGSVTTHATAREAATQFLIALSGEEWGSRVSAASERTTPFRRSQVAAARDWAPTSSAQAARSWATSQAEMLSLPQVLFSLRIPGHKEYLEALDQAVAQAVAGKATTTEALTQAAQAWRKITARLGFAQQQQAYRKSVVYLP